MANQNRTYACFYPGVPNFEVVAQTSYLATLGAIQHVKEKLGKRRKIDNWKLAVVLADVRHDPAILPGA